LSRGCHQYVAGAHRKNPSSQLLGSWEKAGVPNLAEIRDLHCTLHFVFYSDFGVDSISYVSMGRVTESSSFRA